MYMNICTMDFSLMILANTLKLLNALALRKITISHCRRPTPNPLMYIPCLIVTNTSTCLYIRRHF